MMLLIAGEERWTLVASRVLIPTPPTARASWYAISRLRGNAVEWAERTILLGIVSGPTLIG